MRALLTAAVALALAAPPAPADGPPGRPAAGPAPASPAAATAGAPAGIPDLPPPPAVRLAVVPLAAPAELALLGRSLADAVAQEARAAGFEAMGTAAVAERLGDDGLLQASRCGGASACLAAPGLRLGVAWVVGGSIERTGSDYRYALVLVDPRTGAAKARVARSVPIASGRIRGDVIAAAGPLLRGEAAGTGVLSLRSVPPGADVRIDRQPAGRTPLEVRLPPGRHEVEVGQPGKVRVEPFWVEVPESGRVEREVRLHDVPVAERRPGEVETVVDVAREERRRK